MANTLNMQSAYYIIRGKVQGVFFRANTKTTAENLGIKGWVKNTREGDVEVLAQGSDEQLKAFEEWCRKGPSRARVEEFVSEWRDSEEHADFEIVRDH